MTEELHRIIAKADAGERVDAAEALRLYREAPTPVLGRLADAMRARTPSARLPSSVVGAVV